MEISKEQLEVIEHLEKYTKGETYRKKNLEEDIITVLGLLKETQMKNKSLEELLQGNLYEMYKYYRNLVNSYQGNCISKEIVKDKLKKLEIEKEKAKGRKDNIVEQYTIEIKINILQYILKESEK